MSAGRVCVRAVVVAEPTESVREAALLMTGEGVGTVVVLDAARRPIGIVTDRDLVVRCLAPGGDPDATPIEAIMSAPVATVREATPIEDALAEMSRARVQRLPVVGERGNLVGILSLHDVLDLLAEETATVGRVLRSAPRRAPV